MSIATVTPNDLAALGRDGRAVELIDVRTPAEFRAIHAVGARNVPLSDLNPASVAANRPAGTGPLYVICQSGSRGRQACETLLAAGLTGVVNVEGGTRAWAEAGLPVNRGQGAISLERQVRIVAGLLVLAGAVLGYFVHPDLIGLSAFVGAGLVFAGVTDTCGVGLLLARMPWNIVAPGPATCAARRVDEPTGGGS